MKFPALVLPLMAISSKAEELNCQDLSQKPDRDIKEENKAYHYVNESGVTSEYGWSDSKCECLSKCGAHIWDQFTCDICEVADSCEGASDNSFGHKIDYCSLPPVENSKGWQEKMAETQAKIDNGGCGHVPGYKDGNVIDQLKKKARTTMRRVGTGTSSSAMTFENFSDQLPVWRNKNFHSSGVVCQFEHNVPENADNKFTGLLASGEQNKGFIRLASASAEGITAKGPSPGAGIKYYRTGHKSANYVTMNSIGSFGNTNKPDANFFNKAMSNIIPPITINVGVKKFMQVTECPFGVGISELSDYTQEGVAAEHPLAPFKIILEPTEAAKAVLSSFPKYEDEGFVMPTEPEILLKMQEIPVGTPLYQIWGCRKWEKWVKTEAEESEEPHMKVTKECGDPVDLGFYTTTTKCTSSLWADEVMYFRHQRLEMDWIANPEAFKVPEEDQQTDAEGNVQEYSPYQFCYGPGEQRPISVSDHQMLDKHVCTLNADKINSKEFNMADSENNGHYFD